MRWQRAMVTGASSGIGESIARQLAARGTDLVLVARRGDRLEELANQLSVDVEVLVADLADDDERGRAEARLTSDDEPIDLLVANAGIAWIGSILESDVDNADTMIRLNVLSLARMVHLVLPRMVAAGRGGILVTSSTASFQPTPFSANYGATKAFVTSLAEAVH
ncbi:MAG: SDR family NAD(P)-dependent oxidoreductase, partial [Acidimicrobiales bacterium]